MNGVEQNEKKVNYKVVVDNDDDDDDGREREKTR